jgi:vesicle coat complex subunit
MLMMTSIIRVGQSKFVAAPIDEDSQERIMNCLQTLSQANDSGAVTDIFLHDTKAAFAKMVASEEVIEHRVMIMAGYLRSTSEKSRGERRKGDQGNGYPSGRRNHIPTILQEVRHRWS